MTNSPTSLSQVSASLPEKNGEVVASPVVERGVFSVISPLTTTDFRGEIGVSGMGFPEKFYRQLQSEKQPQSDGLIDITFRDAVGIFIETKRLTVKTKTAYDLQFIFQKFIEKFGDRILKTIVPLEYVPVITAQNERLSTASIRLHRVYFRNFAEFCVDNKFSHPSNSLSLHRIWPPPPRKPLVRGHDDLSIEEENILCRVMKPERARVVRLSIALGFRRSTLWALQEKHIVEGMLVIPGEYLKNGEVLRYPLTEKTKQLIGPLTGDPERHLIEISMRNWDSSLKAAGRRAGLKKVVNSHMFRRTWCRRCREAGLTCIEAKELQNWKNTSTILASYWPNMSCQERIELIAKKEGLI